MNLAIRAGRPSDNLVLIGRLELDDGRVAQEGEPDSSVRIGRGDAGEVASDDVVRDDIREGVKVGREIAC